jgi:hypothetical protein
LCTVASFGHNTDTNLNRLSVDNLTVAGLDILDGLSRLEPAFSVEAPLEKDFNLATGVTTLRLDTTGLGGNPVFCAGRVSASAIVTSSVGRVGYTVTRPSGFAAGVYRIAFASPAPNNDYVISLAQLGNGNIKVWESTDFPGRIPSTTGFHVVTCNTSGQLADYAFHFSVFPYSKRELAPPAAMTKRKRI